MKELLTEEELLEKKIERVKFELRAANSVRLYHDLVTLYDDGTYVRTVFTGIQETTIADYIRGDRPLPVSTQRAMLWLLMNQTKEGN